MSNLKYYYLVEFTPQVDSKFPGLNLSKDFPGMTQAVAGSIDYDSYEACTTALIEFFKTKIETLNSEEETFKTFFEKNQFNKTQLDSSEWEENEVVKIYIADSKQSVYNSIFKARIFFLHKEPESSFLMAAPTTLQ